MLLFISHVNAEDLGKNATESFGGAEHDYLHIEVSFLEKSYFLFFSPIEDSLFASPIF